MKTMRLFQLVLALITATSLMTTAWAKSPKMKMTTDIPASITASDKVETSIGTLNYFDGVPTDKTVETVYDCLDRSRAVNVFINSIPMMSMYTLREGQASVGADASHKICIWDKLMDSTTILLTGNTSTMYAVGFLDLLKVYPLSKKDHQPEIEFINVSGKKMNTVLPNDYSFFEKLHDLIQGEPDDYLGPGAKGMMAAIGIRVIGVRRRKACCEQWLGVPGGTLHVVSFSEWKCRTLLDHCYGFNFFQKGHGLRRITRTYYINRITKRMTTRTIRQDS
jgi:hypothetical protein